MWRLTALTKEATGSNVVCGQEEEEQRKINETWPGTRATSVRKSNNLKTVVSILYKQADDENSTIVFYIKTLQAEKIAPI